MEYVTRLLARQKAAHAEKVKELYLSKVFHEEHALYGSDQKVLKLSREIERMKEEENELDFIIDILNEGEVKRIYSIYQNQKPKQKGELVK